MARSKPYPRGCRTQHEVNIGYHPRHVDRDANLRFGPGPGFPLRQRLLTGQRVGRQSVPNPAFSATPQPRAVAQRLRLGLRPKGGRSGWVDADVLDADPGGWADGPASVDFEVGSAPGVRHAPRRKPRRACASAGARSGRRVIGSEQVYLRYAAHSTPFEYLMSGDIVERRWRHPRGYVCVRVISSKTAPEGAVGWVVGTAFQR